MVVISQLVRWADVHQFSYLVGPTLVELDCGFLLGFKFHMSWCFNDLQCDGLLIFAHLHQQIVDMA